MISDENEAMQLKCTGNHLALYTWICELRNQVQTYSPNRELMDLPTKYTMDRSFIGSDKTLKNCIDDLAEWGIIEIISRSQGSVTKIKLAIAYLRKMYGSDAEDERMSNGSATDEVRTTKTVKTIQTNKTKKTNKGVVDFSFPSFATDAFKLVWSQLIGQPKWKGKSAEALQKSLDKLAKYDEAFCVQQMNEAIENNWQGVVFPKRGTLPSTDELWLEWQATLTGQKQVKQSTTKRPTAPGQTR